MSVRIEVPLGQVEEHADAEEVDSLARHLREELLQLYVESVDAPSVGLPPVGTKSGAEVAAIGTFLVTFSDPAVLSAVVETIKMWIGRSNERTARLEIDGDVLDMRGVSASAQERLIDQWIARHNGSGD